MCLFRKSKNVQNHSTLPHSFPGGRGGRSKGDISLIKVLIDLQKAENVFLHTHTHTHTHTPAPIKNLGSKANICMTTTGKRYTDSILNNIIPNNINPSDINSNDTIPNNRIPNVT